MEKENILDAINREYRDRELIEKEREIKARKTIEKNKLIADFLGDKVFHLMLEGINGIYPNFDGTYYQSGDDNTILNPLKEDFVFEFKANFHTSWDWLVPVIHKILHDNNDSSFFKFSMSVSNAIFNNNIDNAHNVVVEFIKEYNQKT